MLKLFTATCGVSALVLTASAACAATPEKSAPPTASSASSLPANSASALPHGSTAHSSTAHRSVVRPAATTIPRPDHVVVVMEENHSYGDVIGNSAAPYINSLATGGASFTQSFAVTHPSEPNYLALFSGSTHSLTSDSCPHSYTTQNLGSELIGAGSSFTGFSESMPSDGYTGCSSGAYARKHNPWVNFAGNVPAASNRTLAAFPSSFSSLPTVSFVIPNLNDDMHDGTVAAGDSWLKSHLDGYAQWAKTHNSLLVVTWDEDDNSAANQIPTIFYGQHVRAGTYAEHVTHYSVLRTLEDAYGLPRVGSSATATAITDCWQ